MPFTRVEEGDSPLDACVEAAAGVVEGVRPADGAVRMGQGGRRVPRRPGGPGRADGQLDDGVRVGGADGVAGEG
ncbi:MAG: hypothetical protein AB1416_13365, partial [Actinomycetota bacterium]